MHLLLLLALGALLGPGSALAVRARGGSVPLLRSRRRALCASSGQAEVFDVDVSERTTSCLDFDVILRAMRERAVTVLGKNLSGLQAATSAAECVTNYARVEQMFASLEYFPLRTDMNVEPLLRTIEMNSSPPEKRDLAKFSENIETIEELLLYFEENKERLNLLLDLSSRMKLPNELLSVFTNAFDDEGNLNGEKYPEIMRLRKEISSFKSRILQIIQSLLKSQDMKEKLADSGYTEIEGRFCLMLKNTYKKGVGVVHGSSNTGRTMYVEPQEVVELTNEMKGFQGQLRAEENRILFEMCRCIAAHLDEIRESVKAVAEIDVVRAKAMLGKTLGGVIPEVHDEGCIRCLDAKHPVLMLRGTDPVGNKVELSESATALVISGPNAGGKTIVLKTAGLFALMAKHAIPISAKAGARIDMFEVMADIGDMQTVSGDLSTFSGHLVVCRNILTKVKEHSERGGKSLVLFDEIGTGTDPAQGAALAQAVLEELLLLGSRVIVTTHYQRIKELAAENSRFQIAAMEFVENRPTYRLRLGSVGESFALEAGRRMNLPEAVLERANCLLDDESRRIVALQLRLEQETERARLLQVELQGQIKGLEAREAGIEASKVELEQQLEKVRQGKTDEFLSELRNKEKELIILLKRINDMAVITSSATPVTPAAKAEREKAIEETIAAVKSLKTVTEKEQVEQSAEDLATPLVPGEPIEEGTTLIILERGHIFGSRGIVTQRNKGRGRVLLRVAGVEVKMERHLLGVPHKSGKMGFVVNGLDPDAASELSSKDRRLMKMLQEDLVDPGKIVRLGGGSSSQKRTSANTLDVRTHQEKGLDHVQVVVSQFIERLVNEGATAGYLQHGSTKDTSSKSTKEKVRQWLKRNPLIIKCGPAPLSEGADSFTLLELVDDE